MSRCLLAWLLLRGVRGAEFAWTDVTQTNVPTARTSSGMVVTAQNRLWMWGGDPSYGYGSLTTDLHYVDIQAASKEWQSHAPSGNAPVMRSSHNMMITPDDMMYMYGGGSDDIWSMNLQAATPVWTEISTSGTPPQSSRGSAVLTTSNVMWVFGGSFGGCCKTNHVTYIDLTASTPQWTSVSPTGELPEERTGHVAVMTSTDVMYIFGGHSDSGPENDLWKLDTKDPTQWVEVSPSGSLPGVREEHTAAITSADVMWIVAGWDAGSLSSLSDVWYIDLQAASPQWTQAASVPDGSWGHAMAITSDDKLWVFAYSSLWNMDVEVMTTTDFNQHDHDEHVNKQRDYKQLDHKQFDHTQHIDKLQQQFNLHLQKFHNQHWHSTSVTASSISTSSTSSSSSTSTTASSSTTTSESRTSTTTLTTSSTTLTGEDLAKHIQDLQRQEEAAQAVAAVEAIEEGTVQELLQALFTGGGADPVETGGILAHVTRQTKNGTVKITAVVPQAVRRDGVIEITSGETASVHVPAAVLAQAQAGDPPGNASRMVLIGITDIAEQKASKFVDRREEGEAASVVKTQTLSITLRNEDGKVVEIGQLLQPIELVLESEDAINASCAFWDEEHSSWSFRGLETLPGPAPGQLTCRTQHLSIFSGVLNDIQQIAVSVIECSSIWELFTQEGVERLAAGRWISSLPAISTLLFVALFFVVLMRSSYVDRKMQQAVPWEMVEPVLFREKPNSDSDSEAEGEDEPKRNCCVRQLITAREGCFWCAGICFGVENMGQIVELLPNAPEATVNRCIKTLHAHRSGVAKDSLTILLPAGEKFDADTEDSGQKQVARSQNRQSVFSWLAGAALPSMNNFTSALRDLNARWNVHVHGASAVKSILDRSWCARVGLLLPAFHPWIALLRLSIVTSYKVRVSLIFLKICTSGATNALFFSSNSPLEGSDPKCWMPKDYFRRLVTNTIVGFLAAFLGDCIVFTLFLLQARKPVEKRQWSERAMRRQIATWRCKGVCFWFIWLLYSGTCVFYVMIFLANVRLVDAHDWYQSTGMSLLQDLLVLPLALAVAMGTLASLALRSRDVRAKIESRWGGSEN
ncbi:ACBP4 [Symbiodinium sp. CCMP2592]|nr:ACBP4 [Symbiodinium sp. CCMP2592]